MEFSSEGVLCVESDTILDMLGIQVAVDCPLCSLGQRSRSPGHDHQSRSIEELDKVCKTFD